MSLHYIHPFKPEQSFTIIAKHHIAYLRRITRVQEIPEDTLDNIYWVHEKNILLHPILLLTIGDRADLFPQRQKRLEKLMNVKNKIGGFEPCDTDQLSEISVNVLNHMDLVITPSTWGLEAMRNSGVITRVEVLPHGVSQQYFNSPTKSLSINLNYVKQLKESHNAILVLYFLQHSGYRKGADVVAKAMKIVQDKMPNVFLVVKRGSIIDPYLGILKQLKTIEVAGHLEEWELVQLYDLCDILIVPSRGGGFELNALEGLARGIPTIVPNGGCFKDYIKYAIPIKVNGYTKIFRDNPIHVGMGINPSWEDLARKITHVARNLQAYKEKFAKRASKIREQYSWEAVNKRLASILRREGFI